MMMTLDILSLVLACVAIAFGVVAIARARSADEVAQQARSNAAQALEQAEAATRGAAQAGEVAGQARSDAATALDRATLAQSDAASSLGEARLARTDADGALSALSAAQASIGGGRAQQGADAAQQPERLAPIRWSLEQAKGALWLMRNVGEEAAHAALLSDVTQPPKYLRPDEVIPRAVPPGDHLQFRVLAGRNGPPPRVRVTWRESDDTEPKSQDMTLLLD